MVSFDPSRLDFSPYGFSCARWVPSVMRRPDRHNEIELNFMSQGSLTYLFGGQVVRVGPGCVTAFWAAIPHQIVDHGVQNEYFVLTIPLGWFLRCKLPDRLVQALLHGRMCCTPSADRIQIDQQLFGDWERDLRGADPTALRASYLEIEARLRRLAFASPEWSTENAHLPKRQLVIQEGGFSKAEMMAQYVAKNHTEQLTVDIFAREMGLHRKLAMNLFHKIFGTSFVNYVTQHRISHAQRLLVTTMFSVVDIANASGFGSLSRFNNAFRLQCGCSPTKYRETNSLVRAQPVDQLGNDGMRGMLTAK